MTGKQHRRSVHDRARRRAIRAHAASLGISYTAAARLLNAGNAAPAGGIPGGFPVGTDEHRAWLFAMREQRSFRLRLQDTRTAVDLPLGRAAHLTERFPPLRLAHTTPSRPAARGGSADCGALYAGERRQVTLGLLYALLRHETPALLPAAEELSWVAELGEETAVDFVCAQLDRAARLRLDEDRWCLWTRIEAALVAGEASSDRAVRDAAITLAREFRTMIPRRSIEGARNILDALLVAVHGGYPPGARVRILAGPGKDATATVVGACWQHTGPPARYRVRPDTLTAILVLHPDDMAPPDQPAQPEPALA
ncbi:hypothetical protein [Rhizocola hellebori]|nr:hypothetical protein [Rhizocola hellebori]